MNLIDDKRMLTAFLLLKIGDLDQEEKEESSASS